MKFLKLYIPVLIITEVFVFLGGYMLFDLNRSIFIPGAACALIITVVARMFLAHDDRIDKLEKRIEELEKLKTHDSTESKPK